MKSSSSMKSVEPTFIGDRIAKGRTHGRLAFKNFVDNVTDPLNCESLVV
jgi:hypothetical protein